jgi:hypothetical protein
VLQLAALGSAWPASMRHTQPLFPTWQLVFPTSQTALVGHRNGLLAFRFDSGPEGAHPTDGEPRANTDP